ncbi:MAG: gamma carbonic anhydrase family protein [Verrucomicrobiota bacterium]
MNLTERLSHYLGQEPDTEKAAFIAPTADLMGSVTCHQDASVWYQCVLRGDINDIIIGQGTNIQDGTVIHLADDFSCQIGDFTTVGHQAMVHACEIGNECLIGMKATILDGAKIGNQCIIGAGALVTKNTVIPDGSLVMGAPAKIKRSLTVEERSQLKYWAEKYIQVARAHHDKLNNPFPN